MNLANFIKSPNFIRQISYNSWQLATIVSILTFLPNLIHQIDFFTFSPNFSPTKLLSYVVVTYRKIGVSNCLPVKLKVLNKLH